MMTINNTTMQQVWDQSQHSSTDLVVLLAIASYADDLTGIAYPGLDTLAQKARVESRQVINIVKKLEKSGELIRIPRRGRNRSNVYLVTIGFTEDEIKANLLACDELDLTLEQVDMATRKGVTDYTLLTGKGITKRATDYTYSDSQKVQSNVENVQRDAPIKPKKVQSKAVKGAIAVTPEYKNNKKESIHDSDITESQQPDISSAAIPVPDSPPAKEPAPAQAMFSALAEICRIDLDLMTDNQRGELNQTESRLRKKGVAPGDLLGFSVWWYECDWRGKESEPPKPHQVREEWGKYQGWISSIQPEPAAIPDHIAARIEKPQGASPESQLWRQIAEIVAGTMTKAAYDMHVKGAQPVCRNNGTLTVQAASPHSYEVITHRLTHIFDRAAGNIEAGLKVEFVLG